MEAARVHTRWNVLNHSPQRLLSSLQLQGKTSPGLVVPERENQLVFRSATIATRFAQICDIASADKNASH